MGLFKVWLVKCQRDQPRADAAAVARGFRKTRITESPRRNILLMKRSLLTGFDFFFPLPGRGTSVHISLTFSSTMLQCLSNAFTRASNFLLFRQLMRTLNKYLFKIKRGKNTAAMLEKIRNKRY